MHTKCFAPLFFVHLVLVYVGVLSFFHIVPPLLAIFWALRGWPSKGTMEVSLIPFTIFSSYPSPQVLPQRRNCNHMPLPQKKDTGCRCSYNNQSQSEFAGWAFTLQSGHSLFISVHMWEWVEVVQKTNHFVDMPEASMLSKRRQTIL